MLGTSLFSIDGEIILKSIRKTIFSFLLRGEKLTIEYRIRGGDNIISAAILFQQRVLQSNLEYILLGGVTDESING